MMMLDIYDIWNQSDNRVKSGEHPPQKLLELTGCSEVAPFRGMGPQVDGQTLAADGLMD